MQSLIRRGGKATEIPEAVGHGMCGERIGGERERG